MKVIAKFLPVLALFFFFPAASSESLSGITIASGALYSEWSATPAAAEVSPVPAPARYGSFTVSRPQSELFIGGLAARWRAELSGLASAEQFEEFALRRFRAEITTDGGSADIGDWLAARGEASRARLLTGSADYLTSYLTGLAERSAGGLPFVRNVEWDYQSALGERRWSTGLSALGALREGSDDAVVWQMRAFAAEESSKGANAGLIYRRVAGDGLIGVNTFLDYENNGDYDKAFWRGSLGAEYRSAVINVYLNRYFGITDGVQRDGGWVYTQDGTDAELDIQVPDFPLGGFSGGVTYYRWEGEYGDEDDKGFRYHLQLKPSGLGARLRFRLEFDSPDVGSADWGGAVSYSYLFGAPAPSVAAVAASGFDPRAHFFDPVRREYSQRIVRSAGSDQINYGWVAGTSYLSPVGTVAVTLTAAADNQDFPRPHTITAATEAASTLRVASGLAGWAVSVYQSGRVVFTAEDRTNISIVAGTITVQQSGSDIGTVLLTTAEIALRGAALEIGLNSAGDEIFIELEEGGIEAVVPYGDIRVLAAHGGETVTVTAGIAAGIRAEIRIVDGAITVMSEEPLPIGTVRSRYEWVTGTSYLSPVGADAVTLTAAADARDFPRPHTITAATEAASILRVASERAGWAVSVYQSGRVVFTAEDRTNINIVAGTITVQQSRSDIRAVHLAAAEITLLGAALEIGLNSAGDEIFIELEEGGVDAVVPYGDIRALAAHGGEVVTVTADSLGGVKAEIRIVDGAITVVSEERLPVDADSVRSRIVVVGGLSDSNLAQDNVWSSTGAGESLTLAELASLPIAINEAALAALKGTLYLSGGLDGSGNELNAVWRSVDGGASWVSVGVFADKPRSQHSMVSYNDKLYIIGGLLPSSLASIGEVLSSSDGVNWNAAGTIETTLTVGLTLGFDGEPIDGVGLGGGFGRSAVVHNNTLFIIGGGTFDMDYGFVGFNDSFAIDKDGTIHTLTVSNDLPAYGYAAAVSFKGTIYRIGGQDSDNKSQNGIWSSVDGQNWTRLMKKDTNNQDVPANFPVPVRYSQAVVHEEGIYVLGGEEGGVGTYDEVWYSTNAKDWEEVSNMPSARILHAATVVP